MSNQKILNKVVKHVRKQGKPSYDAMNNSCKYRLKEGKTILMCGIGCLVPDKEYVPEMDDCGGGDGIGFSVSDLVNERTEDGVTAPHIPSLISKKRNLKLMMALQEAHDLAALYEEDSDSAFIDNFNDRIKKIARDFRLKQV